MSRLRDMTHGELYAEAEAAGMTFELIGQFRQVCIGSGLLGWDRERTDRVCKINREMKRRWKEFVAFVELKLLAAGPVTINEIKG